MTSNKWERGFSNPDVEKSIYDFDRIRIRPAITPPENLVGILIISIQNVTSETIIETKNVA